MALTYFHFEQGEIICQKRTYGRFQNDRNSPHADGGKGDNSWSELTTYKSPLKNVSNNLKNEQVCCFG
jgi:hypothetical protein